MSKRIFTKDQIEELLTNENIKKCSDKSITYDNGFKMVAVKKYLMKGDSSREIFQDAGFDLDVIGVSAPKRLMSDWTKIYKKKGAEGFVEETRGRGGGRPKKIKMSDKEKIVYLEAKVAYMDAENDFLAKLRGLKRE